MDTNTVIYDIASNDNYESHRIQRYEGLTKIIALSDDTSSVSEINLFSDKTHSIDLESIKLNPLIQFTPVKAASTEKLLQEWSGIVLNFNSDDDYFRARLIDKTNPNNSDEEADIILADVPEEDFDLITPGAEFSWFIYYEEGKKVPRKRSSKIKFRRLGAWNQSDIHNAKKIEKELLEYFNRD